MVSYLSKPKIKFEPKYNDMTGQYIIMTIFMTIIIKIFFNDYKDDYYDDEYGGYHDDYYGNYYDDYCDSVNIGFLFHSPLTMYMIHSHL